MSDMSDRTEYQGGGVMPNTIFPKGNDALTPSDKLRLGYITGVEDDSRSSVNPGQFYGNSYFDPNERRRPDPARVARERRVRREEGQRYKESPRPRDAGNY